MAQPESRSDAAPRPFLVTPRSTPHGVLALWHLLSLDAPTVAVTWAFAAAFAVKLRLPAVEYVALFVAVWMLYAADRLLDARAPTTRLELRHHFHHAHRRAFQRTFAGAAMVLAITLAELPHAELRLYCLLGALLLAWLLLVHTRLTAEKRLPKELAVAIFFPAAVFIPTVARLPGMRLQLLAPAALLAATCALNCLFLYAWEHPRGGGDADAHGSTRFALRHLGAIAGATIGVTSLATVVRCVFAARLHLAASVWVLPCASALACVGLTVLHGRRRHMSAARLRAAADLVLLTPLPLLALVRMVWR